MRTLCRCCGWPLVGTFDRCPWCEALVTQRVVDDTWELEPMVRDDDRAWADYRDEQDNRRAVLQGVA